MYIQVNVTSTLAQNSAVLVIAIKDSEFKKD
jgi:hypothetical protein